MTPLTREQVEHLIRVFAARQGLLSEGVRMSQQVAEHDSIKTRLEIRVQELTSALDILCQAIEQGDHDDDYMRRRAAEGRMALAQGRGA